MVTNKKIKNATSSVVDGITMKSKLEVMAYKTFKEAGLNPIYEKHTFVIVEGFKPTIPYYIRNKTTKILEENHKKIIDIKYTPDFVIKGTKNTYFIEMKGMQNDTFPIKKKLFRKYLEEKCKNVVYFELYTKREVLQAIEIINSYEGNKTINKDSTQEGL